MSEAKSGLDALWAEAQEHVIGAMLLDPECVPAVLMETEAADFTGFNRDVYDVIRRLDAAGRSVDLMAVAEQLPEAVAAGMGGRLVDLRRGVLTSANVREHARIVREQARLSALRSLASELSAAVDLDAAREIVAKAEGLTVEHRGARARSWAQMIDAFMEGRRDNRELEFLDWGIPALNGTLHVRTGPESAGKYILLGGEPSSGKSALMFQLAQYMSRSHRVGIFSYETDEDEMTERMASGVSHVSFNAIIRNRLSAEDWGKLTKAFSGSYGNTLETIEASGMDAGDVAAVARARRYEVIFVDYVQLVAPGGDRRDTREQQVAKTSRTLQQLAHRKPGVTVVALSQLSRPEQDKKSGRVNEPGLHAFRESGQLEQDADAAMVIYKTFPKAESWLPRSELRKLSIVKNKKDALAKVNLRFDGNAQTFTYTTPQQAKLLEELEDAKEDNPFTQEAMAL